MTLDQLTEQVRAALADQGLRPLATVRESARLTDVATISASGASWMFRCAETVEDDDHLALATILAQGPFERAALVYANASPIAERNEGFSDRAAICSLERLPALLADWRRKDRAP